MVYFAHSIALYIGLHFQGDHSIGEVRNVAVAGNTWILEYDQLSRKF